MLLKLLLYSLSTDAVRPAEIFQHFLFSFQIPASDRVVAEKLFPFVGKSKTRGHNLRVKDSPFKTEMWRNLFSSSISESSGGEVFEYTEG